MATELTRVLQQGDSRAISDDKLERLLAGSLQSGSDAAGYDVAKEYIKQVFGQLYGDDDVARSNPPGAAPDNKRSAVQASAAAVAATAPNWSSTESSDGGARWHLGPGPAAPPSRTPAQHVAQTAVNGITAPPWTAVTARGSAGGAGAALGSSGGGGADDELERPRPRPHHGRIKEQLDLLQNADQLAAIISVATTAATTAAAAAVKQTMQTPPPLPPGAYARMHAAGQPVYGLAVAAAGSRLPQTVQPPAASAAAQAAPDGFGDESPDPQPQQRQGALVSPHRRATPMIMVRRQEANAGQGDLGQSATAEGPSGPAGSAASGGDAQLGRQRLRWSQRPGVPLGALAPGAVDGRGAASPGDVGSVNAEGAAGSAAASDLSGNSNLRVVRLGVPRVTARTPTPVRPQPIMADMRPHHGDDPAQQAQLDAAAAARELRMADAGSTPSSGDEAAPADGAGEGVGFRWAEHTGAPARSAAAARDKRLRAVSVGHSADVDVAKGGDISASRQPLGAQKPGLAEDVPAEGFYVTGGESIFARPQGAVAAGGAAVGRQPAARAAERSPVQPRRAMLPEDVRDAFRSTLAFIADPDAARAQQHQPPTWAALADVEECKEAQREAEELLGGAFDYAAVKRELERARRASRLMQRAGGPGGPPPAPAGAAPSVGTSALKFAGGRGRPGPGAATPAAVAATGLAAKAATPRGDFAGLLPPPHSVWDVDEAWHDLDEFSKAVEAEVAYRAAAPAGGPSRRGSPGPKPAGQSAIAATATATTGPNAQTGRAGARPPGVRAILAGGAATIALRSGQEQADTAARSSSRKRAASPGPRTRGLAQATATAAEASPSPPRAVRKTQASGPVRVAFGRRVDEPPKAAEPAKARAGSPSGAGGSPRRIRTRTKKGAGVAAAASATAAAPSTPSSTGDAVHQVLSALASVLLSDEDEGDDHEGNGHGAAAVRVEDAPHGADGREPGMGDMEARRGTREAETQADAAEALPFPPIAMPELEAARVHLPEPPRGAALADLEAPLRQQEQQQPLAQPAPGLPSDGPQFPSAAASSQGIERPHMASTAAAPYVLPAADVGSSAAAATPLRQPGLQAWPNTTATSRPRFQYVIDTAHPPITRLPAWAASAAAAEGAPTAYAAAMGAAPTGLGFGTPTRRRQLPAAAAAPTAVPFAAPTGPQPLDAIGAVAPQAAQRVIGFVPMTTTSVLQEPQPERQAPRQPQEQLQQAVFHAPAELLTNTLILPAQAAAAAVAAAAAADAPVAGRRGPDPGQQWEEAVLQAVEDEVVSRLAAVQLLAQGGTPQVTPQSLPGMVPPLVDAELSRRLVCDVLRENLRTLMVNQRQHGTAEAQEAPGVLTLEEVVAALTAAPVLPPRLQQAQGQREAAAPAPFSQDPGAFADQQQWQHDGGEAAEPYLGYFDDVGGASDGAAELPGAGEPTQVAAAGTGHEDGVGSGAEGGYGADAPWHDAGEDGMAEQSAVTHAFPAAAIISGTGEDHGAARPQSAGSARAWQPVYAGRRAMQQASQATQAAPDTSAAAVQAAVLVQSRDAATAAPAPDLPWPTHAAAGAPYSSAGPAAPGQDAPAASLAGPPWATASRAGLPAVASTAGAVAASTPGRSPLGFAMSSTAPAPSVAAATANAAATAASFGMGGRQALVGPQSTTPRQDANSAAPPAAPGSLTAQPAHSPSRSQGIQAYGVQARGVQAHGAEARGVQAHGVVEARGTQAHGAEARGTQASGMQERATQAAGVQDSSSQADPPLPHYLLQAALAAGLSYGSGPPQPAVSANAGFSGGQPIVGPDGAPLTMPRPFYLVPADNTQLPSALGVFGPGSGLAVQPYIRGEGSRPPLNIPGLSKLRDSSDVESSTDSMGRHLQGPGARARAAALEALRLASRVSLDSDDGLLQRSYAQLELAALSARPVRLAPHRVSSESSQPASSEPRRGNVGEKGPHSLAPSDPGPTSAAVSGSGSLPARGDATGQARALGPAGQVPADRSGRGGTGAPVYLTQGAGSSLHDSAGGSGSGSLGAASQGARTDWAPGAGEEAGSAAGASRAPSAAGAPSGTAAASLTAASRVSSFAVSEQSATAGRQGSGNGYGSAGGASGAFGSGSGPAARSSSASAGASGGAGSREGSATPSGELSHVASPASLASSVAAEPGRAGQDTPARHEAPAGVAGRAAAAVPGTPAVADDELVEGDDFADDDPDQIHSLHFDSSEGGMDLTPDNSGRAPAAADAPATGTTDVSTDSRSESQGFSETGARNKIGEQDAEQPVTGPVAWGDGRAATPAGAGGRYSGGAGADGDFALSDDELLDDAEVTRVLDEEDALEQEEEEEDEEEALLDEEDDELRAMEGQVTVLEDSEVEDEAAAAASAPTRAVSRADPTADASAPLAQPLDGMAFAPQGSDSGGSGNGGGDGGGDNPVGGSGTGGPQASAGHTTAQSRAGSLASSGAGAAPAPTEAALATGRSGAGQRASGSGSEREGTGSGSHKGGNASDHNAGSGSGGSRVRQSSAPASSRVVSFRGSSAGDNSEPSIGAEGPAYADVENQPVAGAWSNPDDDDVALRASMERLSIAGLAPVGRQQSSTGSGGSGVLRATVAPSVASQQQQQQSLSGRTGAAPLPRPALAPLQPSAVQSASEGGGASQPPDSPSKPPSLANYHGPTRQLWRPPTAQQPQDPLMSSSETLLASSEASVPALDPLSRALHEGQRRARAAVGQGSGLAAAAERAQAPGLADSIADSSLDVSASMDSIAASSTVSQQRSTAAGAALFRQLAPEMRQQPRGVRARAGSSGPDSGGEDTDEDGPASAAAAGLGGAVAGGRGSSRRDGAVFRLRQYGARRRKLMQQIEVKDPLLMSSATSLSTNSSTVSDSEEEDGYPSLPRGGVPAATRRM